MLQPQLVSSKWVENYFPSLSNFDINFLYNVSQCYSFWKRLQEHVLLHLRLIILRTKNWLKLIDNCDNYIFAIYMRHVTNKEIPESRLETLSFQFMCYVSLLQMMFVDSFLSYTSLCITFDETSSMKRFYVTVCVTSAPSLKLTCTTHYLFYKKM